MDDPTTRGWNGLRLVHTTRFVHRGRPVTTTLCTPHTSALAEEYNLDGDPDAHVGGPKVGKCEHPNHELVKR